MRNVVIERMLKRIEAGNLKKEDWQSDIFTIEVTLNQYLKEKGYIYEERCDFGISQEENLNLLLDKEKASDENPILLLPEGVKNVYDRLIMFLDSYHIGFVHDFHLNRNGNFETEISLHIYPPSTGLGGNDVAKRLHYESGLDRLQKLGMVLNMDDRSILATDRNKKIILDILEMFCEPRLIRFSTREEELDVVHFIFRPGSMKEMALVEMNPITDEMTKLDTTIKVKKYIKEMCQAIGSINSMPELTNTCGYIIEDNFTYICDLLGIETELAKKYHGRHAEIRKVNSLIHEKEKELGNMVPVDRITTLAKDLFNSIGKQLRDGIGYRMNGGTCITRYNGIKISVDCIPSCSYYDVYLFDDDNDIDESVKRLEEKMERTYDMIEPFPGERYIAFTKKNLDVIMQWVRDTYNSELENIVIENRRGELYIKTISFYINNISACL